MFAPTTLVADVEALTIDRGDPDISVCGNVQLDHEAKRYLGIEVRVAGPEGGCIEITTFRGDKAEDCCVKATFLRDDDFAAFRAAMQWAFAEVDRMRPMARELFVNPGESYEGLRAAGLAQDIADEQSARLA